MRLATFAVDTAVGTVERVAVVDDADADAVGDGTEHDLLDVTAGYARLLADDGEPRAMALAETVAPPSMIELLRGGERSMDAAREVRTAADRFGADARAPDGARIRYAPEAVRLLSPLPRPNSIRDCMVFEDHGRPDKPDVWYEYPVYYTGNPDSVVSPGADVPWPDYDDQPDFELEVAAVIGREGRDVAAEDADAYVAGYTIFDDFSAREIQLEEMQGWLGPAKGKDFANGFGPYLVTADAFDPADATAVARVDGEEWATGSLSEMYHSFDEIVEHVSRSETIHPGDVIGSGTVPGGCALDLGRQLEYGSTVELEVDGLGTLRHRIVDGNG